jgi:hypothetical protein
MENISCSSKVGILAVVFTRGFVLEMRFTTLTGSTIDFEVVWLVQLGFTNSL